MEPPIELMLFNNSSKGNGDRSLCYGSRTTSKSPLNSFLRRCTVITELSPGRNCSVVSTVNGVVFRHLLTRNSVSVPELEPSLPLYGQRCVIDCPRFRPSTGGRNVNSCTAFDLRPHDIRLHNSSYRSSSPSRSHCCILLSEFQFT